MSAQGSSKIVESNRGPAPGEAYGAAELAQKLQGVNFPVSKKNYWINTAMSSFNGAKTVKL